MTQNDRYEKIRKALAMGPTPGPWDGIQHEGSRWTDICQTSNRNTTPVVYVPPYSVLDENGIWKERKDEAVANAKYVAACDPDTIRELLAERDALREALEMMVEMVEMNGFGRDYAMDVARAALKEVNDAK